MSRLASRLFWFLGLVWFGSLERKHWCKIWARNYFSFWVWTWRMGIFSLMSRLVWFLGLVWYFYLVWFYLGLVWYFYLVWLPGGWESCPWWRGWFCTCVWFGLVSLFGLATWRLGILSLMARFGTHSPATFCTNLITSCLWKGGTRSLTRINSGVWFSDRSLSIMPKANYNIGSLCLFSET